MVVVLAGSAILIVVLLTRSRNSQSVQLPTATQQQSSPSPAIETKTADKSAATSPINANKGKSASTQTTVPAIKSLIVTERTRNSSERPKREGSKVASDKKKVEQPKPTGESFIPVSRP
jgi:hypothetical protein